jgi:hypothetical protein
MMDYYINFRIDLMLRNLFLGTYILVIFIRLFSILLFLQYPLAAWLLVSVLDIFDYGLCLRSGLSYSAYQKIDKVLDFSARVYFVIVAYVLMWEFAFIFLILLLYRLVGDILYFKSRNERFFFYFPNISEFFFPIYILFILNSTSNTLEKIIIGLVVALLLKLAQEYLLHIKDWIDPVNKRYILKQGITDRDIS